MVAFKFVTLPSLRGIYKADDETVKALTKLYLDLGAKDLDGDSVLIVVDTPIDQIDENDEVLYQCDPCQNIECSKESCYVYGGECWLTRKANCRKEFGVL